MRCLFTGAKVRRASLGETDPTRREINNLIACDFYFLCCIIAAGVARHRRHGRWDNNNQKKLFFGLAVGGRHIIYWQALPADVCFIKRRRGRLFYKIGGIFLS
jgi:hypothetical protein